MRNPEKMQPDINFQHWNDWLQAKQLSYRTIKEYNQYLSKLYPFELSSECIMSFISKHNNIVAHACINNLLAYLYATTQDKDVKTLIDSIKLPKVTGRRKKLVLDFLTEDEVYKIESNMMYERDKLMVLLTFYGGLRASELLGDDKYAIRPYSFQWATWLHNPENVGILKVTGKGNKQRKVFIPQKVMARTYQYIKNYIAPKQSKEAKIFQICHKRWSIILANASIKALERPINPHLIRHSCSMWLKTMGWDINERKAYLGHEDVATTIRYDHLSDIDLNKKFNLIHQYQYN